MPRLIMINGAPGSGKSTLARRYVDEHSCALNLDVDRVRDLIGGWRDDPGPAGLLARGIALAAARCHLDAGFDVVIAQFVARPAFLEQVEDLARAAGAGFHEVVLWDTRQNTLLRFAQRGRDSTEAAHRDAALQLEREGGLEALARMYDRLAALVATRPAARLLRTRAGEVDRAYHDLVALLG